MSPSAENDAPTDADLAAQVREACDAVGIPYDVQGLIRHHRGNAALAAAFDGLAQQSRERVIPPGATDG
jgi:hypothetical protein